MIIGLMTLTAAAVATHTVQIDHHGTPVQAVYSARADVTSRTIGAHTPNRMDSRRCLWQATIHVDRKLENSAALARTVSSDKVLKGSQAGNCQSNGKAIERELARHDDSIRDHMLAIAEQDRAPLLAEIDSVRSFASN